MYICSISQTLPTILNNSKLSICWKNYLYNLFITDYSNHYVLYKSK